MKYRLQTSTITILMFIIASFDVVAHEVTRQFKGITINANFELADGKKPSDDVVIITHGGLAHRGMEIIVYLQNLLKERGFNTLAINLSLGLDNRHGMYDCAITHTHKNDDVKDEIEAWIAWLAKRGVQRVTLLGHSRGGAQTALFAAERDSSLINAVVLLAPATLANNDADAYMRRYNKRLAPVFDKAQSLVKKGLGNVELKNTSLLLCPETSVTAASFVSYYNGSPRLDTPQLLPKINKPTLVVVAGNDSIVVKLEDKVAPFIDGKFVQMEIIDGSDHFFRDLNADDAVDAITSFMNELQ